MFSFLKNKLKKAFSVFDSIRSFFSRTKLDEQELKALEISLIKADVGVKTARSIIDAVRKNGSLNKTVREIVVEEFRKTLALGCSCASRDPACPECFCDSKNVSKDAGAAKIYLLVGINGSGKTSLAGKLAHQLKKQNKKMLMVAGDTFRAAATEQLQSWATRAGVEIVVGADQQDPASVIYAGCDQFKAGNYDAMIIDTAGRLQTKIPLMKELEKIKRTIAKQLPNEKVETLLVLDSMLGQNSLEQAQLFNEATPLDGVVLTKMDGTGKGGIVFAISSELSIPIVYISCGEKIDDLEPFNAENFIQQIVGQ